MKARTKIQVRWLPPPINWLKLNSDGSSMGNPGLAGGGGLIRNEIGEWVKGYARATGCASSVAAELWAKMWRTRMVLASWLLIEEEIPLVRIQYCYREANKCADALASHSESGSYNFHEPPSDVAFLLNLDSAGTPFFRDVASGLEVS
uniref:RNase H type-1 domain-containing protein n=1 Tax=Quercus lobata TaxID=97700 RepID=A0A7N2LJL1_QUELO